MRPCHSITAKSMPLERELLLTLIHRTGTSSLSRPIAWTQEGVGETRCVPVNNHCQYRGWSDGERGRLESAVAGFTCLDTNFSYSISFVVLKWKNNCASFSSVKFFSSVSTLINPSSSAMFYWSIQIKPFTKAKEQSTKLILTDLCGMYLWD